MRRAHWIFLGLMVAVLVYEIVTVILDAPGDTISEIVWALSVHPMIPFGCGVLAGHFFFPRRIISPH